MSSYLWILPKWPFPIEDGSRVATVNLIRQLTALGDTVDLLALVDPQLDINPDEARWELGVRHVYLIAQEGRARSRLGAGLQLLRFFIRHPELPITLRPYCSRRIKRLMMDLLEQRFREPELVASTGARSLREPWQLVVYEGPHAAAAAADWGRFQRSKGPQRLIYRAQNCEARIWESKAGCSRRWWQRLLLKYQAGRMRVFEGSLVAAADAVAAVSAQDLRELWAGHGCQAVRAALGGVVPIGCDFEVPGQRESSGPLRLLFLGRLDWPPNYEGLIWFLKQVWPVLWQRRGDLELLIAGSGAGDQLEPYLKQPGVRFLGRVQDLRSLYASAALALVPIFYGSGTRVKAIEAACFGVPCLSTALGVEGLGLSAGVSYFQAETAAQWVEALLRLEGEVAAAVGRRAHEQLRESFSSLAAARTFQSLAAGRTLILE